MKSSLLIISIVLFSLVAGGNNLKVTSEPLHDWWWKMGEEQKITLLATDTLGKGEETDIKVIIKGDREDSPVFYAETFKIQPDGSDPEIISFNPGLTQPGFYKVMVKDGPVEVFRFNIGLSPEEVVSSPDSKSDMKEFWAKALQELSEVPLNLTMKEIPEKSGEKRKIYFCQYLSLDNDTVSGYLALPVKEGKYPAIIYYNGYNGQPWDLDADGLADWIEFQHWVRGQGPNKPYNRYGEYALYQIENPEEYYYRGAFMDAVRTIDFIESLPQTDAEAIFAEGGSQGGAFTFAAAALDPGHRLKAIAPYIPFLSDYEDYFEIEEWPGNMVKRKAEESGIGMDQIYDNLTYFDIKNLTPWITIPVLMGVGLQDSTCPPHTNFAAYNNLGSIEKEFMIYPRCGHTVDYTDWNPRRLEFFKRVLIQEKK